MSVAHCRVWKILLEAVDFQNRKKVILGPLVSISLYRGRKGLPSSSRQPISCPVTMAALLARVRVRWAHLPVSACVRWWLKEGTRTPSTWHWWMGDVVPSFHRLLLYEPASPQHRLGSVWVVYRPLPPVRHPSAQCHSPPRRAWSRRTLSGCRKESTLRSFAVWCCWS
jgi:hypothetical protein